MLGDLARNTNSLKLQETIYLRKRLVRFRTLVFYVLSVAGTTVCQWQLDVEGAQLINYLFYLLKQKEWREGGDGDFPKSTNQIKSVDPTPFGVNAHCSRN